MNKTPKGKKKPRYLKKEKIDRLAQEAYLAYAQEALKNAAHGNVMPTWDDLFDNQRDAWRIVIKTINRSL